MGRLIFDEPPWWQQTRWRVTVAAAATATAAAVWWVALRPLDHPPNPPRMANAPVAAAPVEPTVTGASARAVPAAASAAAPLRMPLSTMVAPGVHITPLSVPPGTEPMPAGPRAHDSESEN